MRKQIFSQLFSNIVLPLRSINWGIALFGLLLIVSLWFFVFWKLNSEKEHAIQQGQENAANFAQIYEENTLRTIKSADQFALFLKYQYERDGRNVDISPYYSNGKFQVEPYLLLSIADEKGDLVLSNQIPFVFSNIADREHFLVHKDQNMPQSFISKPVLGRSSGKWSIQVTRRLNHADGDFAGVVIISLDPFYFTSYYNRIHLGNNASVALVGKDGIIRAWQSGQQALIGMDVSISPAMILVAGKPAGQFVAVSAIDGIKRFFAFRVLRDYPLVLVVGLDEAEVLKNYYEERRAYYVVAVILSLFILLSCSLLIGTILARQRTDKIRLALYKISDLANTTDSLEAFYEEILKIVQDLIGTKYFYIAFYDEKKQEIEYPCRIKFCGDTVFNGSDEALVKSVLQKGKPLFANSSKFVTLAASHRTAELVPAQWLGAPLKAANNHVFGVMVAYTFQKFVGQGHKNEIVFSLLANQVEMAIENKYSTAELRKLSSVIEQSPVTVIITDTQGDMEYVNPAFSAVTGFSAEEALASNPRILKSGKQDAAFFAAMWTLLTKGQVWQGEVCNKKKNGEFYWARMVISPIRNRIGTVTHFVGIQEDITSQKELEVSLRQAKEAAEAANKAKSTFLANMSHEIRTPMNAILGFVQLLERDSSLNGQQRQYLATISRSGKHLLAIINDVLEMSKIEAGRIALKSEVFDLAELVRAVEELLRLKAEAKGLIFAVDYNRAEGAQFVSADAGKLRQVLINLLDNAVKFTNQGKVSLQVATSWAAHDLLRVHFAVTDSGPGISVRDQSQLFQSFEQTESGRASGGTGLGLAISREYVRKMGGDITIRSLVGQGSVFSFEVLFKVEEPVLLQRASDRGLVTGLVPGQKKYRILIVDDVESNRLLLAHLLEDVGFTTRQAVNGAEAVASFLTWQPDLILMDIVMPKMDGYEAIRQIRSHRGGKSVPILAVTASVFEEERQKMIAADANDCLRKPVQQAELFEKIEALLPVTYLYDGESALEVEIQGTATNEELQAAIVRLPAELSQRLCRATIDGDYYLLLELLETVRQQDELLASALQPIVQEFAFQRLSDILSVVKGVLADEGSNESGI